MYTCYISKYKEGDNVITTPVCIYDKRSPALDLRVSNPVLELSDSGAGSFSFVLPITHFMYDKIVEKLTEVTIKDDDEIIFEGSVISNEKDWNNNKKITVEGYAAYLNNSTQPRKEYFNIGMKEYLEALIEVHNNKSDIPYKFEVRDVDVKFPEKNSRDKREQMSPGEQGENTEKSEISTYEFTQYENTMYYLRELSSRCGGHFIFTRKEHNCYYIDYKENLELDSNAQTVALGENLLDYNESNDFQLLCTSVLPVAQASTGVTSEIGEVLGMVPHPYFTFGELSQVTQQLDDEHVLVGDYIYVLNNSDHDLYKVTSFYEDLNHVKRPNLKIITDHFILHQCCVLAHTGTDILPTYMNAAHKDVRTYRNYACLPNDGSTSLYYLLHEPHEGNVLFEFNGSNYVASLAADVIANVPYHVIHIENIWGIKPDLNKVFITARSHYLGEINGMDSSYLVSFSYPDSLIGWERIKNVTHGDETGWTSLRNAKYDMSYSSGGATFHGAKDLYVAGWGSSNPTEIRREAYYYNSERYSIGTEFDFDEMCGVNHDIHRAETLNNTFIFDYGEYNDGSWYWTIQTISDERYAGYSVLKLYVGDIHDKIYISTRSIGYEDSVYNESHQHWPYEDGDTSRNNGPLWYAADSSNQLLYKKNKTNNDNLIFNSIIYDAVDLSSAELYGAEYIYISCFGSGIPVIAAHSVEQSGSMTDYITVETASEYWVKLNEGETGDECLHEKDSLYVESQRLIDIYGRIERKIEFNKISSPEMLLEKAVNFLTQSQLGEITKDIQGIDLHEQNVDISRFRISTKIPVWSPAHKCNEAYDLVSLTITLDNPVDSTMTVSKSITIEDRLKEVSES